MLFGAHADRLSQGDRSIATYARIAVSEASIDYFVSHLTKPEYFRDVEEMPNRVQDTMPWIVKKELGDEIS